MNKLFNSRMKYLFLIPIALLIGFLLFFQNAMAEDKRRVLDEKMMEKDLALSIIAESVNLYVDDDDDWGIYDYPRDINRMIHKIDTAAFTFAAQYDSALSLLSQKSGDAFNPMQYPAFKEAVLNNEKGSMELTGGKENPSGKILLHYLWVPEDSSLENRSLLVAGIEEESVQNFHDWLVIDVIVLTVVTFLINMAFVVLLCYLGNISFERKGAKWRASP